MRVPSSSVLNGHVPKRHSPMESLFTRLKHAREQRGYSLSDLSAATNINVDFLDRLERGETDMLPQVYVRAFVREYASVVGLDPDEAIREYELTREPEKPAAEKEKKPESPPPRTDSAPPPPEPTGPEKQLLGRPATYALAVTILALLGIVYWNLSQPGPESSIRGTDMTHNEVAEPSPSPAETVAAVTPAESDSLTLTGTTTDSVWVLMIIDSRDSVEHLMRPHATRTWKAQNSFRVSLGRPEAIEFVLNGVSLGTLGQHDRIVRDSLITRQTLTRLRQQD